MEEWLLIPILKPHVSNHRTVVDDLNEYSAHSITVAVPDQSQHVEYLIDSIISTGRHSPHSC